MRRLAIALLLVLSCARPVAPAAPAPPKRPLSVQAWRELGDELCRSAGASGSDDEGFTIELPRAFFFADRGATLRPESRAAIARVAAVANTMPPNTKVLVRSALEDDAVDHVAPDLRWPLSAARAAAIAAELESAGLSGSRIETSATATEWQGSYDGPAVLAPEYGRIELVLIGVSHAGAHDDPSRDW
jgi:hypothetical protein